MEISLTFPDQLTTACPLQIIKKVGQGKFSVYQAYCPSKKASYALKVFPKDSFGATQYKKEAILSNLTHSNVIQQIPASVTGSEDASFYVALTEFAKYGDFFELVVGGVLNSEVLIRTYFHQLVAGIEYIHSQGVAHLDLKLENLMMGADFTLKVIDFDQAQPIKDEKITSAGTKGYRAPEVINGSCKNFAAADVYSAGVILYVFKAQEYPFAEQQVNRSTTLKHYSTFMKNNQAFWAMKDSQAKEEVFSESFKELVNGMLNSNVEERFTLEDIKQSKWYNGPVLDGKKLKSEMRKRWEIFSNANNQQVSY